MDTQLSIREQIAAEADEWLLKLHVAGRPDGLREEFTDWLMQSPAHIESYLAASRAWYGLAVPDQGDRSTEALIAAARAEPESGNVIPLRTADRPTMDSWLRPPAVW